VTHAASDHSPVSNAPSTVGVHPEGTATLVEAALVHAGKVVGVPLVQGPVPDPVLVVVAPVAEVVPAPLVVLDDPPLAVLDVVELLLHATSKNEGTTSQARRIELLRAERFSANTTKRARHKHDARPRRLLARPETTLASECPTPREIF
jgi:hypothetical protein